MATITKRGNSYRITVSCGYDLNGKQLRRTMTWAPPEGMTKRQAEKELDRQAVLFEEKCRTGQVLDGNIKFADFAEKWFKDYAEKQLRPTTVAGYRRLMKRILPAIGHIRLDRLQPHHLMAFYDNLSESGIRENTVYKLGENWPELLKDRGVKQAELARLCGVDVNKMSKAAHGAGLYRCNAEKIAAALNLPLDTVFVSTAPDSKLSGNSVQHYHRLISSILSTAVKWQVIFSNPCERVDPPKIEKKEAHYLDETQAARLLEALEQAPEQYRVMVALLLFTGLRRGELCGLEWDDIDWDEGLLSVRRSSLYLPKQGIFTDETKTATSQRVIKLPDDALTLLRQHRTEQAKQRLLVGDQWQDSHRLFTTWNGSPIHPDTFSKWFSGFVKAHDLPPVTAHSLRHTNATLLIAAGVNVKTVSAHLGHATIATTGNIYAHAIKSAEAAAAEALQSVLTRSKKRA